MNGVVVSRRAHCLHSLLFSGTYYFLNVYVVSAASACCRCNSCLPNQLTPSKAARMRRPVSVTVSLQRHPSKGRTHERRTPNQTVRRRCAYMYVQLTVTPNQPDSALVFLPLSSSSSCRRWDGRQWTSPGRSAFTHSQWFSSNSVCSD
jgi:hypothetical protein